MATDTGQARTEPAPRRRSLLRWPLTAVAAGLVAVAGYALAWVTGPAGPGYAAAFRVLLFPAVVAVPAVLLLDIVRDLHGRGRPRRSVARHGPALTMAAAGVAGAVALAVVLLIAQRAVHLVMVSPLAVAAGCVVGLRLAGAARPWLTGIAAAGGAITAFLALEVADLTSAAISHWSTNVAVAAGAAVAALAADRRCLPEIRLASVAALIAGVMVAGVVSGVRDRAAAERDLTSAGLPLVSADVPGFELHLAYVNIPADRAKRVTVVLAPRGFEGDGSPRDSWHCITIVVMAEPADFPPAGAVADGPDRWRRVSTDDGFPSPSLVFYVRHEGVLVTVEGTPAYTDEAVIDRASHSLRKATAKELAVVGRAG